MEEEKIPQEAILLLEEYRKHYSTYVDISHRRGTNGERGLHGQYRIARSKMRKTKEKLEKTTIYTFVTNGWQAYLLKKK